jgi:signal transduction histidine kinase
MIRAVKMELIVLSEDVHALSYRLHPSILEDLGLASALKAEAEHLARLGQVVRVAIEDLSEPVPREAALCVFRIAQEALRNAMRHSKADTITLSLRSLDGGLQLAVQDNGCGFVRSMHREHPSLGIAGMKERARLLGGELEIESQVGHGTTVVVWVPVRTGSSSITTEGHVSEA